MQPGLLVVDAQGHERYGQAITVAEVQALRLQAAVGLVRQAEVSVELIYRALENVIRKTGRVAA